MLDLIIGIVESNIDYKSLIVYVVGYFFILWLIFCIWVFNDAKKRYKNTFTGLFFALLVLFFNFPALIFYFIIRPEKEDDALVYFPQSESLNGVNIPVVNFTGEDGVNISFQLKITKSPQSNPDMNVNVEWNASSSDFEVVKSDSDSIQISKSAPSDNKNIKKTLQFHKIKKYAHKLKKLPVKVASNFKSYGDSMEEDLEKEESSK
jgi:hypothetical protein